MSSMETKITNVLGRLVAGSALLVLCGAMLGATPLLAQPPPGGQGHWGGGPGRMQEYQLERMTKDLNLSPGQVTQIKGYFADEDTQMKALRDNTSLSREDRRTQMFTIRKNTHTEILGALSEQQKTEWEAMQAKMRERRRDHGQGWGQGQGQDHGGVPPPGM